MSTADAVPSDQDLAARYGEQLLEVAARSIRHGLEHGTKATVSPTDFPEALRQQRATFVTLEQDGALRGCIGTVNAYQPLVESVAHNAHAAAFEDPRFAQLTLAAWPALSVSISILSPMEPVACQGEAELVSQLRPGVDGLSIRADGRRGVFLPQVWKVLPQPREFLDALWEKAGLSKHSWPLQLKVERFTATSVPARIVTELGGLHA